MIMRRSAVLRYRLVPGVMFAKKAARHEIAPDPHDVVVRIRNKEGLHACSSFGMQVAGPVDVYFQKKKVSTAWGLRGQKGKGETGVPTLSHTCERYTDYKMQCTVLQRNETHTNMT